MGLSISERIVKRMGGRITLESQPGIGSTFEVAIPLAAADGNGDQKAFAAPDLAGQSIMVVAPQSIEATLIARRLQRWGGQTCMVSDVAVARALLPERGFDAMRTRRGVESERALCSGPGKLCQALAITREHNGLPLDAPPFELLARGETPPIVTGPRIGITRAAELTWRYGLEGSPFLSRRFR